MTREEILRFINQNPVCHLATLEDGKPRVRGMFMYRADENGLLFHTGAGKSLAKQIRAGAPAEACFNSPDVQVRVAGVAEIVDDLALKKEVVSARPFMQPWIAQYGYDMLVLFRIAQCEAYVWTMADNFQPTAFRKI
ncbi:MAG: pyridoxamine 5'-phosphate oxidase family protein [Kiritimatiellia bacterium]